jgi:hypothetical protein
MRPLPLARGEEVGGAAERLRRAHASSLTLLPDVASRIRTPLLITDPEGEQF